MTWDCQAYGPEGKAVGALCFFAETGERACGTQGECHTRMADERVRVFGRIQALAAEGDQTNRYLAAEFTDPEQLLGGAAPPPVTPRCDGTRIGDDTWRRSVTEYEIQPDTATDRRGIAP